VKSDLLSSSFEVPVPIVDNIYELVVVAAQRARQLNEFQMHMQPDEQINPVEKALSEAYGDKVEFSILSQREAESEEKGVKDSRK